MSKVLVLYYSSYGHVEALASAVAEGAREAGTQVDVKRVPEVVPDEVARNMHFKLDQAAPVAKIDDLAAYDAAAPLDWNPSPVTLMPNGLLLRRISQLQRSGCSRCREVTT